MAKSPEDAVILSCFCKNSLGILFKLKISKNKSKMSIQQCIVVQNIITEPSSSYAYTNKNQGKCHEDY